MYELDGSTYSKIDHIELYRQITKEFIEENPSFIGVKLILQGFRFDLVERQNEVLSDLKEYTVGILNMFYKTKNNYFIKL